MPEAVPDALRRAVSARRAGWRVPLAPAMSELVAYCACGVAVMWMFLVPAAFIVWMTALTFAEDGPSLATTAAVVVGHAVGALAIGLPVAVTLNLSQSIRWMELRPAAAPTRIVLRLWCRRRVVPVAELTEVVVRERRRYGRPTRIEVDLVTGDRTEKCAQGMLGGPLRWVDSRALAGWLSELLCQAGVPVRHEFVVTEGRIARKWWPAERVAEAWDVPIDEVPDLATRCEIHTADLSGAPVYSALEVEQWAVRVKSF
jgi:hypothetical protein